VQLREERDRARERLRQPLWRLAVHRTVHRLSWLRRARARLRRRPEGEG
jgi:hypothetical protein